MLLLSDAEVASLLTMECAIDIQKWSFYAATHFPEFAQTPDRSLLALPPHGTSLFKPSSLPPALGIKVVSVRAENVRSGLPTIPAVILLMDVITGIPTAMIAATHLTAVRTAAGSGVATDLFARQDATTLTIFGAGLQARAHIHAMVTVRPTIRIITIVNRTESTAITLRDEMIKTYPHIDIRIYVVPAVVSPAPSAPSSPRPPHRIPSTSTSTPNPLNEIIAASHIICTTTNSYTPLFDGNAVSAGTHINAVGSYLASMQELDSICVSRCKIVLDSYAARTSGDILIPLSSGMIKKEHIDGDLGAYIDLQSMLASSYLTEFIAACPHINHSQHSSSQTSSPHTHSPHTSSSPQTSSPQQLIDTTTSSPTTIISESHHTPHHRTSRVKILRTSPNDITLFKSVGTAVQDVTTAYAVVQLARQQQTGSEANIM